MQGGHINPAYREFRRLGLEDNVPEHSTFSKNRHGRSRDSDMLRELPETTVRRCVEKGLAGDEDFAVDHAGPVRPLTRAPRRQQFDTAHRPLTSGRLMSIPEPGAPAVPTCRAYSRRVRCSDSARVAQKFPAEISCGISFSNLKYETIFLLPLVLLLKFLQLF